MGVPGWSLVCLTLSLQESIVFLCQLVSWAIVQQMQPNSVHEFVLLLNHSTCSACPPQESPRALLALCFGPGLCILTQEMWFGQWVCVCGLNSGFVSMLGCQVRHSKRELRLIPLLKEQMFSSGKPGVKVFSWCEYKEKGPNPTAYLQV